MFKCKNCGKDVDTEGYIGTKHRNHCPYCLYSVHLDRDIPGDRKEKCKGLMKPFGITFKSSRKDKYGKDQIGEIMIVHKCSQCGVISNNRIAGDDSTEEVLKIAKETLNAKELKEVQRQLLGE